MKRSGSPFILFFLVLLPRLWLWLPSFSAPDRYLKSDSTTYWQLGQNIWHHFVFSESSTAPWLPHTKYAPAYPFFLGFLNVVLKCTVPWIVFIQILLSLVAVYAVWRWLTKKFPANVAFVATLAFGLDLTTLFHVPLLSSDNLFLFVITFGMLQTWRCLQTPMTRDWILAGLLWGLAIMVRPVALFFPLFLFFGLLFSRRPSWNFLAAAYLLPALWCVRNYAVTNHLMFTSQGGIDILLVTGSDIEAVRTHRIMGEVQEEIFARLDAQHPLGYASEMERSDVYGREATRIILHHPLLMTRHMLTGAVRILGGTGFEIPIALWGKPAPYHGITTLSGTSGAGTLGLWHLYPWLIPLQIAYGIFLAALYFFFGKGVLALWQAGHQDDALLFLAGVFYFILISCVHVGYYRYRIPILPFLVAGAAGAPTREDRFSS